MGWGQNARCVWLGLALAGGLGRANGAVDDFESPPDQAPAAVLPAAMVEGQNFHVVDPVHSDGLMLKFEIDSRFGKFDAYGVIELDQRIREIAALTQLEKISPLGVVADSVSNGVMSQVSTVTDVAKNPVATLTGIPRGVSHLFHGAVAQSREVVAEVKSSPSGHSDGSSKSKSTFDKGEAAAKHYADHYFGLTAADRRWYKKLGLDPYTTNETLRRAIHKNAKLDATASFGLRFAGLPAIAGLSMARRAMDAIYNEDPAVLRARQRASLTALGLTAAEIEQWQNTAVLSPTGQTLLLGAAEALNGVSGRAELFRHAMSLTSEAEAQVYLRSVGLLVLAHRRQAMASILPDVRLPTAVSSDGRVIVCGAFESVYWTAEIAEGERHIRESLSADAARAPREWRIDGSVSARTRGELENLGWQISENAGSTLTN